MQGPSPRPSVDVVVPFAGPPDALDDLLSRLRALDLRAGDSLTVVDNRAPGSPPARAPERPLRVIRAGEVQSSYFARNRGAAEGTGEWLLFIDADVEPPADLADRYLDEPPEARVAVLAGAVVDEPLAPGRQPAAARFAAAHAAMSQANTLRAGPWGYAQTANCAVRRAAFEQLGGFRDDVRSGGDADLCFRLRNEGWEIEPRAAASVIHRSRPTLRRLLRQRARHGSGAAWLESEYPGFAPRGRLLGRVKWTAQSFARATLDALRGRREDAAMGFVEPLYVWAFELGRMAPNTVRGRR
jgi:GT2 family glycosyltransferase